ncbi:MAG: geranylgeranyl diphosphate reductase [Halieaceae bacterium]
MSEYNADYDTIVVGGGPSGATAANDLARSGHRVLLLERGFRIKPCGGAIPPCLMEEFDIPEHLLVARIRSARMVSPRGESVDMPIDGTYVGMVDRDEFDPWLRERAAQSGADVVAGVFKSLCYEGDTVALTYQTKDENPRVVTVTARSVIGADGARSGVARATIPDAEKTPWVLAYHEIIEVPEDQNWDAYDPDRCDVWYQGRLSPDFYAWVFPHGRNASIGVGSAHKDFSAKASVAALRQEVGLEGAITKRKEGAPIPMKPMKRWDDGRAVLVSGDAAGVVAPASGEGIYYAMLCGRLAADAVQEFLMTGDPRALGNARKRFMKLHGKVFWVLGLLQRFWYGTDKRREKFVAMCRDPDVQTLTWQSYTTKKLVRRRPLAHVRVFFKDVAQLLGLARA